MEAHETPYAAPLSISTSWRELGCASLDPQKSPAGLSGCCASPEPDPRRPLRWQLRVEMTMQRRSERACDPSEVPAPPATPSCLSQRDWLEFLGLGQNEVMRTDQAMESRRRAVNPIAALLNPRSLLREKKNEAGHECVADCVAAPLARLAGRSS